MMTKTATATRAIIADAIDNPEYDGLSVAELARRVNVSETGIRRLIKDGQGRPWGHNRKKTKPKATPREFVPISANEFDEMQDAPNLKWYRPEVVNFW